MFWSNLFFIPVFFVCSGYTTSNGISLKRKFKKLIVPYLILNVILLGEYIAFNREDPLRFILGILYGRYSLHPLSYGIEKIQLLQNTNAPTWFLCAMFMAFVFLKGILHFKTIKQQMWVIISYIVCAYFLSKLPILLPWSVDTALIFSIFIYVGIYLRKSAFLNSHIVALISLTLYIVCMYINGLENLSVGDYGENICLSLIGGITGSLCFIYICKCLCRFIHTDIFCRFNRYALIIFCIQMPLIGCASGLLNRIFTDANMSTTALYAILQTLIVVCTGIPISIFLKKLPYKLFKIQI